ncbi:hypothetical protein GQ42DRAFT_75451 [Ramicandelaber brevisporus]|nr:hypothetical protein GQ42DRAFT_75451 [Ramicandelaber brevisporus]
MTTDKQPVLLLRGVLSVLVITALASSAAAVALSTPTSWATPAAATPSSQSQPSSTPDSSNGSQDGNGDAAASLSEPIRIALCVVLSLLLVIGGVVFYRRFDRGIPLRQNERDLVELAVLRMANRINRSEQQNRTLRIRSTRVGGMSPTDPDHIAHYLLTSDNIHRLLSPAKPTPLELQDHSEINDEHDAGNDDNVHEKALCACINSSGNNDEQCEAIELRVLEHESADDVDAQEQCSICLCDHEVGQTVRQLPCGHVFHLECIDRWLVISATCPCCKTDCRTRPEIAEHANSREAARLQLLGLAINHAVGRNAPVRVIVQDNFGEHVVYDPYANALVAEEARQQRSLLHRIIFPIPNIETVRITLSWPSQSQSQSQLQPQQEEEPEVQVQVQEIQEEPDEQPTHAAPAV